MRDFSPFVTFPGLKFQPGVMVRVLSQGSCDYMGKVSLFSNGLGFSARTNCPYNRKSQCLTGLKFIGHAHSEEFARQ